MTEDTHIRRRPDGSIDTAHYMRRGRTLRSDAAHRMASGSLRGAGRPATGLAALVVAVLAMLPTYG